MNSSRVSNREFKESLASVGHYYNRLLETLSKEELKKLPPQKETIKELRRSTLEKMIDDALVFAEVKTETGGELDVLVKSKIDALKISNKDFEEAVNSLYGLRPEKFKELVLIPEARRELLEGRLKTAKSDLQTWLSDSRKSARVVIVAPDLRWDGEKVAVR